VPYSVMPARNGGVTLGFRRAIASEMDSDPADWPCNNVSYSWPSVSLEDHTHHECYQSLASSLLLPSALDFSVLYANFGPDGIVTGPVQAVLIRSYGRLLQHRAPLPAEHVAEPRKLDVA
jgi:hypothetical protein